MFSALAKSLFGDANDRVVKKLAPQVNAINALEEKMAAMDDAALKNTTETFKARLADGETLDDLVPEAFALVREAAKRTLGQRHFDVQLMGGLSAWFVRNIGDDLDPVPSGCGRRQPPHRGRLQAKSQGQWRTRPAAREVQRTAPSRPDGRARTDIHSGTPRPAGRSWRHPAAVSAARHAPSKRIRRPFRRRRHPSTRHRLVS